MNVLVIPEDFRKDGFILRPILSARFTKLGTPAIVEVLTDPLIGGLDQALKREVLEEIVADNRWKVELFILCVDRDGEEGRRGVLDGLERHLNTVLGAARVLAAENAWQELEVWALAGPKLPPEWRWADIRRERDPKEKYFDPLVAHRRLEGEAGGGRKRLGIESAENYRRLASRCREDIQVLETRIRGWIDRRALMSWSEALASL